MINAFIAAFDDVHISRYTKNKVEKEVIKVRYVYAPKERVLFDIVNKAQNITLPAIAVTMSNLARDESRVFNKLYGADIQQHLSDAVPQATSRHMGMPIPINIGINMSIITSYQLDMDQILSNFVPYTNPYIILSWKVPDAFKLATQQEIRCEVLWDGNITCTQPIDTTGSDKFKFIADTSFTIKTWLFPEAPTDPMKNIFFIDSNFYASRMVNTEKYIGFDAYTSLSGTSYDYPLSAHLENDHELVAVSAAPSVTNLYYAGENNVYEVPNTLILDNNNKQNATLTLIGKRFEYTTAVWLSSNATNFYGTVSAASYDHYPTVSGAAIDYIVTTPNTLSVTLPSLSTSGYFKIIVLNNAGWADTSSYILYNSI